MEKDIFIKLSDENLEVIHDIVALENNLNKYSGKKRKERTVEDFVKSAIADTIDRYKNYEDVIKLSGLLEGGDFKFHNRFKELAKEKGLTQKEISSITKIHQPNLNQIFNNNTQPRLDFFLRIWIVLGYPPIHKCIYKSGD